MISAFRFWRRRFFKVSIIYGYGCHLGEVTKTIWTFHSPIPSRLNMNSDFNCPNGFWGEDVKRERTTTQRPSYTISSPMSLWLRWSLLLRWAKMLVIQELYRSWWHGFCLSPGGVSQAWTWYRCAAGPPHTHPINVFWNMEKVYL